MTHKERFIKTLKREHVPGYVPTFELAFYLTMETLGRVSPHQRAFYQWNQMSNNEKEAHMADMADTYIKIAERYGHSAIFVHPNPGDLNNTVRLLTKIRELSNDEYYICMHGDPTYSIPDGSHMMEFSERLYDDPDSLVAEQEKAMNNMLDFADKINKTGQLLDGFTLCSDYSFNDNSFFRPEIFADVIAPVLSKCLDSYRKMGFYTIKHTDGNIMPIVDMIIECKPDALHSIDPQGGVDLKYMINKYGDQVAMCGNVCCALLMRGTEQEITNEVMRSLRDGMSRGKGYIFCTSNCIFTGLPLENYELMMKLYREHGEYK